VFQLIQRRDAERRQNRDKQDRLRRQDHSGALQATVLAPQTEIAMKNWGDRAAAGLLPAAATEPRFGEARSVSRGCGGASHPDKYPLYF
jgi:hypothetical protein